MIRHILLSTIIGMMILLAACDDAPLPQGYRILPDSCSVRVGNQVNLTINGNIPENASIRWSASVGSIVYPGQGLAAVFTAPEMQGEALITVIVPGASPETSARTCYILPGDPTQSPVPSTETATPTQANSLPTIVITEVMANPCGSADFKKWNQYVEVYNYGDAAVDVGGWWLVDDGPESAPDMLVAWNYHPGVILPYDGVVRDTTVIPPHSFAIILSPIYTQGTDPYKMPYSIPVGTIILTIAEGDRLGDDYYGIIGEGDNPDVVVLYIGSASAIVSVVSTYGSPIVGRYSYEVRDDNADNIPMPLHECSSIERINPTGPDVFENWYEVRNGGSPGTAPYLP